MNGAQAGVDDASRARRDAIEGDRGDGGSDAGDL